MLSTKCDTSIYLSFRKGKLIGIIETYVDEIMRAGTPGCHDLCQKHTENSKQMVTKIYLSPFLNLTSPLARNILILSTRKIIFPNLKNLKGR